ncbi:MAG TPA: hypothetical protein VGG72_26090 [Bryobacteraceae bacterium]|jgi:hypothetical protein
MQLKYYFPLSVAIFALTFLATHHFSVPFAPFAAILLAGETLLGFQMEDHKAARFLGALVKPSRTVRH